jgi:hypothetical protein
MSRRLDKLLREVFDGVRFCNQFLKPCELFEVGALLWHNNRKNKSYGIVIIVIVTYI